MPKNAFRAALGALALIALAGAANAQLVLPRKSSAAPAPSTESATAKPKSPRTRADVAAGAAARPTPEDAARFVFESVKPSVLDPGLFDQALRSLAEFGPPSIAVARLELAENDPARLELAVAVLSRLGDAADLDLVADRLQRKLPPG